MSAGGVLLVQPEHLLSFELMGLDQSLYGNAELGNIMVQTQDWLHKTSRDVCAFSLYSIHSTSLSSAADKCQQILDESDEILSPRFELIYTMGTQHAVDFSPDRCK